MRAQKKTVFWIVTLLGLAVQFVPIVALALLIKLTKDFDSLAATVGGPTNNLQQHLGYIIFGFIGVGLSILCYLFIMITIINRNCSRDLQWFVYTTLVYLQFMVSILIAAWLINDADPYNFYIDQKDRLQALGTIDNSIYHTISRVPTVRRWGIAASVVTFVFGFLGGLVLLYMILQQHREEIIAIYQNQVKIKNTQYPNTTRQNIRT